LAISLATTINLQPSVSPAGDQTLDFGLQVEDELYEQSDKLFGVKKPLDQSAPPTSGPYRTSFQTAAAQVLLAKDLKAEYLTRTAANATDMMEFFPAQNPTHLITCVEGGRATLSDGSGRLNPSVQRINLANGQVSTILRGMSACDGIRTTPWGTILATEERSDGGAYEILDPLATTEQSITNRTTGAVTDPAHIVKRTALPTIAWEGIAILPSGVLYAGDELRPGTGVNDVDGGAMFKFVPATLRTGSGPIANLGQSPFVAGSAHAMQVSCLNNTQQYGQGCEVGNAAWVTVNAATATVDADVKGATGYYRPEDLHQDPLFTDAANPAAVRFCWTNTHNEDANSYAEVMCAVDLIPHLASTSQRTVAVDRFIEGDHDFNSFDNLDFQPVTGNLYVIEDHDNGDIFACLRDRADRDIKSDGCIKMLSVKDSSAEPTGFIFSPDGKTAYLSIQHSDDTHMPLFDGYPTDDVLKITGFRLP
jgi:secreted PhoX family phosphatase